MPALRWLALIPFLRCIHMFLGILLSGAGLQRRRTGVQVVVALISIGLNIVILPRYSWRGAAWTSLGCDGLLVVAFWFTALIVAAARNFNLPTLRSGSSTARGRGLPSLSLRPALTPPR